MLTKKELKKLIEPHLFNELKKDIYEIGHSSSYYYKGQDIATALLTTAPFGLNTAEQFATMSVITAAVTAGDLKVTITYRLVPEGPQQQPGV